MDYTKIIKEVGRGRNHARDLDMPTAHALYQAMLAGEVPELELGGLLIAFRIKGESEQEILGFYQAMQERVMRLQAPESGPPPVVIPSYNGARRQANLTPLLALLLSRLGLPVVVHGVTSDSSRVTSAEIFQALGVPWSVTVAEAQRRLDDRQPVFIPIAALSAPVERLLQLRWRMGVRNSTHTLAKLATPFADGSALRIASVSHPEYIQRVTRFFQSLPAPALLLQGCEGEPYANPLRCPPLFSITPDAALPLAERQPEWRPDADQLPVAKDVETTARWTARCLAGEVAVPPALLIQLACCLVSAGEAASVTLALERLAEREWRRGTDRR